MARLSDEEIQKRLAALRGWERVGDAIRKRYSFEGFRHAMDFVNGVAQHAEAMDHHPDILIEYSKVTLTLTSHDSGGLTGRDFKLAASIDE